MPESLLPRAGSAGEVGESNVRAVPAVPIPDHPILAISTFAKFKASITTCTVPLILLQIIESFRPIRNPSLVTFMRCELRHDLNTCGSLDI